MNKLRRFGGTHLNERFDFASPREPFRSHALGHLPGVALDASNDSMWVWALLSTVVELLYDDNFLAGLATLEHDCNLRFPPINRMATKRKENEVLFQACKLKESMRNYTPRRKAC